MAQPPPSGTGQQDKSYFKNSVAKDGKAKAFAKGVMAKTKEGIKAAENEVQMARQYESEPAVTLVSPDPQPLRQLT